MEAKQDFRPSPVDLFTGEAFLFRVFLKLRVLSPESHARHSFRLGRYFRGSSLAVLLR